MTAFMRVGKQIENFPQSLQSSEEANPSKSRRIMGRDFGEKERETNTKRGRKKKTSGKAEEGGSFFLHGRGKFNRDGLGGSSRDWGT